MLASFAGRCAVAFFTVALSAHVGWADVIVRFDPPTESVTIGSVFTLDIVADIPAPVVAWGLDLTIDDPFVLSTWPVNPLLPPPVIGSPWVDPGYSPDGDRLNGLAFPDPVSGMDTLLATVTFSADALGETDLFLSFTEGDLTEGFGLDGGGFAEVAFEPGHVTVIPEPTSFGLLLMGLGVTLVRARRA